jgi:hypothetical protein
MLFCGVWVLFKSINYRKRDNNMLIDGIKIVKQKRNNTCGYVTARFGGCYGVF